MTTEDDLFFGAKNVSEEQSPQVEPANLRPLPGGSNRPRRLHKSMQTEAEKKAPTAASENEVASVATLSPPSPEVLHSQIQFAHSYIDLAEFSTPLLKLAVEVRSMPKHSNTNMLFHDCCRALEYFTQFLQKQQVPTNKIIIARYLLCTFLDEAILSTPWGSHSRWISQSLLNQFHNESHGGDKFFAIIEQLSTETDKNNDLLELCFHCLAAGFQGKYRLQTNGKDSITSIKSNLFQLITASSGTFEPSLSPRWEGVKTKTNTLTDQLSFIVVCLLAAGLMLAVYMSLLFSLNQLSDPILVQASSIGNNIPQLIRKSRLETIQPIQPIQYDLRRQLLSDIQDDTITIEDHFPSQKIIVYADSIFQPGTAIVDGNHISLLKRIASALSDTKGNIKITGHTDNSPIRSVHYPSNWHLSKSRAVAVADILSRLLANNRISEIEGLGDNAPVVLNDSAENRAKNRRIEITLFAKTAQ